MDTTSNCPYCGKPYGTYVIPGFMGFPPREATRTECGCEGELKAKAEAEREQLRQELVRAWRSTDVPQRYQGVQQEPRWQATIESGNGLYIVGPKGTGKTHLACSVLKAYVRERQSGGKVSARFVSVPDWLASMRGVFGSDEERAYDSAYRCSLLVLDDIGKGKATEWSVERLFRLIDGRYNAMRPTVFTSQYNLGELGGRLAAGSDVQTAEAVVSRIHEMCLPVRTEGPDKRLETSRTNP